ncbi:hypothetical protein FG386_003291 [Cryptosporidium ryanae]|uniref:uncharacterized protein n=1 Tax=Cryptosporidium ryanae TaxID=515981 RepID=UPI00351A3293|nr:hypothetical protein FG386_003291 [Cryptosporidium ryanae]
MSLEMINNQEHLGSNVSESSYGEGSLCLSLKDKYKVISRNQLEKVEFPIMRVGTSNLDCGISFIEEISDMEEDYDESPYDTRTRRERIRDGLLLIKSKCNNAVSRFRNGAMRVRTGLTDKRISIVRLSTGYTNIKNSINRSILSKFRKTCNSTFGENSAKNNGSDIAGKNISRSSSILRQRTLNRLNLSKTSRIIIIKKRLSQKADKLSYVLSSKGSYISKRFVNCAAYIKSKVVYNYYRLRNTIGDRFPRRRSKFVLYFKKGSEDKVHKVINCEKSLDDQMFGNALIYDSVEYMSQNVIDDYTNEIDVHYSNDHDTNSNEFIRDNHNFNDDHTNNPSINVRARIEELNSLTKSIETSKTKLGVLYGKGTVSGLVKTNGVDNRQQHRHEENDQDVTPTTIDSFPRLASMDSTTCTIQNDISSVLTSSSKLPLVIENINKMFEKISSIHGQMATGTNSLKKFDDVETTSASEGNDAESFSNEGCIFSSVKSFVDSVNSNDRLNLEDKQTQYYYELLLTLIKQTHKYYENIISRDELNGGTAAVDSGEKADNDNEKIKESIFSLIGKLSVEGSFLQCNGTK